MASPAIGTLLILLSFHHAAAQPEPDQLQFALFWAGFLVGMLPLVVLACARDVSGAVRTWALVGIGLFGMAPRLMQPGPAGPDEFCHLRQLLEAYLSGDVGHVSYLLAITQQFPGMHQAASAFARVTGMPLWPAAMAVIILAHVLSLLAVYQLVRLVGAPARGAAVGAVVYMLNPSWLYFDAVFAYESLALPLAIWCLAATVAACRATRRLDMRALAMALFCVAVIPVIHHLTTIMLSLILLVLIIFRIVPYVYRTAIGGRAAKGERFWPLILISCTLVASITFWWSGLYKGLVSYLGPALAHGWEQLQKILDGASDGAGPRSPFANSQNPVYEIASGFMLPFVLLVVLAGIAWIIVGVPYVLGRAVNRRWHARHAASAQPAAALAQTERRERG